MLCLYSLELYFRLTQCCKNGVNYLTHIKQHHSEELSMKNVSIIRRLASKLIISVSASLMMLTSVAAEPLKIGYSDWPGWVAWEVAIEKEMFKAAGVDVTFELFDYVASMDAFAAGQLMQYQ